MGSKGDGSPNVNLTSASWVLDSTDEALATEYQRDTCSSVEMEEMPLNLRKIYPGHCKYTFCFSIYSENHQQRER